MGQGDPGGWHQGAVGGPTVHKVPFREPRCCAASSFLAVSPQWVNFCRRVWRPCFNTGRQGTAIAVRFLIDEMTARCSVAFASGMARGVSRDLRLRGVAIAGSMHS
jgi:hypothetical protein